jgi:hypothetical protein
MQFAKDFMALFHGLERAHGAYQIKTSGENKDGKKVDGRAVTRKEPVTEELWERHLTGKSGLGIVPIMDDSTCNFGAIDIDVYKDLDVKDILTAIDRDDMPLVCCRTKSGGLHCYLFVSSPVPAALMKEKLSMLAAALGFGDAEIFPKQTEILYERGDIGQWINMPYYDAKNTVRYAYALGQEGQPETMPAEDFIGHAKKKKVSPKELAAYSLKTVGDISDGPPCLQYLITKKLQHGNRNDGLFNIGVYLKRSRPMEWKALLDEYNAKFFDPSLPSTEVHGIIKNLERKEYQYACDKNPMKPHCDKTLCQTREYGVGASGSLKLTGLVKHDSRPPVWFVDVEGFGRLELSTEDLQMQGRFQRRCIEALNTMPPALKEPVWRTIIDELLSGAIIVEAPPDASPKGLLFEYLERFCTSRAQARSRDELLLGKPWTDEGYHYFRMMDFMAYLERQRFYEYKVHQISAIMKDTGAESAFMNIKGKGINTWKISEFKKMEGKFSVPDMGEEVF